MAVSADQPRVPSIREVQPDGSVLITGRNVRFRVTVLKPGFMLMVAKGGSNGPEDAAAELVLLREFELELERSGMLTVFADLRESTRMGGETRDQTVAWMRKYQGRINASHVLVRSKLVEMAMSIVAMLVGGGIIKMYSRPQAFLDLLRQVAPKIVKLPTLD
jgi:hypothetical protein